MDFRKASFILLILLLCHSLASAGELITKEAVNYFNEGVKAQKADNFSAADINYNKALLIDPYNTNWQKFIINNRGIMYAQQGDLAKAEAAFNEALKIDPDYRAPQLNLGFIYEMRRSRLESIEYWLKVLDIDLDAIKPKDFVIQEEEKVEEKK